MVGSLSLAAAGRVCEVTNYRWGNNPCSSSRSRHHEQHEHQHRRGSV